MNVPTRFRQAVCAAVGALLLLGGMSGPGLLAGGQAEARVQVEQGGTLIMGQVESPVNLDPPNFQTAPVDMELIWMIYENLVRFKGAVLEFEPGLAASWQLSADGLTWTFELQKNVKFHDGTLFDAAAVVYNFERFIGPEKAKTGWAMFGELVKKVEAVGPSTVRMTLARPHAFFLNLLAHPAATMVSPAAHRKYGKDLSMNPVGSGPFKFEEWVQGSHLTLAANTDYWRGRPKLDKIICRPVKEDNTRVMQLQAGQLHVAPLLPHETLTALERDRNIEVTKVLSNMALKVTFNNTKKPFDNRLVRQALNYAVDKEAIAQHLYGGYAEVVPGVLSRVLVGWGEERGYGYDPELAKALLAEAGYPNGFRTSLWTTSSGIIPKDVALAETIQQYWAAVGVEARIEKMEWAAMLAECRLPAESNRSEAFLQKDNQSSGEVSDALAQMATKRFFPPAGRNRAFYSNPVVEELITLGSSSMDVKKRDMYMRGAQIIITEDAPWVPLVTPHLIWAQSNKVHGMVYSPLTHTFATEQTWIAQ